jgi:drug/metabolite transporter (DMT)-like permease
VKTCKRRCDATPKRRAEVLAPFLLAFVSLTWGMNFGIVKSAYNEIHPLVFGAIRFTLSSFFILGITFLREGSLRIQAKDIGNICLVGCCGVGLYQVFWSLGLNWTYATNSALLFSTQPLFGMLYLWIRKAEHVSKSTYLGTALAFLGALFVILRPDARMNFELDTVKGDVLTLLACICFAFFFSVRAKPLLQTYSALRLTGYSMLFGSTVLWISAAHALKKTGFTGLTGTTWICLAYAVLVSGVLGHILWYEGIRRIGLSKTFLYQYLVPIWAMLFNFLFMGEALFYQQILGGVVILFGIKKAMKS